MSKPNNWWSGIKRIPLHFLLGTPFAVAAHFVPPPFNLGILGGYTIWRAISEHKDYTKGLDTGPKAVIDYLSQVIVPIVTTAIW